MPCRRVGPAESGITWFRSAVIIFISRCQAYIPRRNHRGDGMLVDHLANTVLQQDNKLIKRFDLTLQLNAIDKINGNGNAFLAKRIQEGFLQRLTSGHFVSPSSSILHQSRSPAPYNLTACVQALFTRTGPVLAE
jgi:hypothetical protein